MAEQLSLARVLPSFLFLLVCVTKGIARDQVKVFHATKYGAKADGKTDNSKAFLKAWEEACRWTGKGRVIIPKGTYLVSSVSFIGPCKGSITFVLRGRLMAPSGLSMYNDQWIVFRYVDWLIVTGGGVLDGQGPTAWSYNDCHKNSNCQQLPISMSFEFVTHTRVKHIRSINSKNTHFMLFGCNKVNISNIRISAPADSPNTDGIKIGDSSKIHISKSTIGTGDDCVAILSGSRNIHISEVSCGPGHGISIGSLGKYRNEENVTGVSVRDCSFRNTDHGVRIKTWASSLSSTASNIKYENIAMHNVKNPIIIDQQYCPYGACNWQDESHVQLKNIKYRNIWGSSSSKIAVTFRCSRSFPCKEVELRNINLKYNGPEQGPTTALCSNIYGHVSGRQNPPSCL